MNTLLEQIASKCKSKRKIHIVSIILCFGLLFISAFGVAYSILFYILCLLLTIVLIWLWGLLILTKYFDPEKGELSKNTNEDKVKIVARFFVNLFIIFWFLLNPIIIVIFGILKIVQLNT